MQDLSFRFRSITQALDHQNEETQEEWVLGGCQGQSFCAISPLKSSTSLEQHIDRLTNQGAPLNFAVQFLVGFHWVGKLDYITDHMTELSL
jgi:hypothetical protein